jgi:hypothetical protein
MAAISREARTHQVEASLYINYSMWTNTESSLVIISSARLFRAVLEGL